jgi:aminoglycoside phosphotransferase (APT) family kinase protein
MTFKNDWEKTDQQFQIPPETIHTMVALALPEKKLASYDVSSGGCVNLNIKIQLLHEPQPLLLRIYVRDKDAAFREQKLAELLKHAVPIPEIYFVGECEGYRFAITEYMPGISLRDFLLNHPHENIESIMGQVGQMLASIQRVHFSMTGFFDADLKVSQPFTKQDYLTFVQACLDHSTVLEQIGPESIAQIKKYHEKNDALLLDETQSHLVHADYDPANILVDKIEGQWKITAILDWEFTHSGPALLDVANMLRYAHHMPPIFEKAFLQGLKQGGMILPENWRIRVHLLNLSALLDCLVRCTPRECPNRCADIRELVGHILLELGGSR